MTDTAHMSEKSTSESTHTLGPWEVRLGGVNPTVYAGDMRICDVRGWGHLTGAGALNLPFEEAEDIQDANARLIAAAPALLAACQAAIRLLEEIHLRAGAGTDVLYQLNDAIAQAILPGEEQSA